MLFNEHFYENNQPMNAFLQVRDAGELHKDKKYVIERTSSENNVIGYILSGTLHVDIYRKKFQVYANTCFILPHHQKYKIYSDPDLPCIMLWMNIRGSLFNAMLDSLFIANQLIIAPHSIEQEFKKITSLMSRTDDCSSQIMKYVTSLLIDIANNAHKPNAYERNKSNESRSDAINRYILNRVQFGFNVCDMAKHFHLSADQLHRVFKKEFATTPYQYYQEVRIDLAKSLLANTDLSIDDISDRLGFSNRNNFSARFTALTKMPPAKYRKQTKSSS